jgi:hypothetical protein
MMIRLSYSATAEITPTEEMALQTTGKRKARRSRALLKASEPEVIFLLMRWQFNVNDFAQGCYRLQGHSSSFTKYPILS